MIEDVRDEIVEKAELKEETPNIAEIIKGYKELEIKKYGKVRIYRPSFIITEQGDKIEAATKSKLLRDKVNYYMLSEQLKKEYIERGLWDEEKEEKMNFYWKQIVMIKSEQYNELENEYKMESAGSWIEDGDHELKDACKEAYLAISTEPIDATIIKKYKELRKEKMDFYRKHYKELRDISTEFYNHSIEAFANYEKHAYFCSMCIKKEDDTPIWNSVDDLRKEEPDVFQEAMFELMKFYNGMDREEMQGFFDALHGA